MALRARHRGHPGDGATRRGRERSVYDVHMSFSVHHRDGGTVIEYDDGLRRREVPPLWLRERSTAPTQLDPVNFQRLFDPHRLPVDLAVVDAHLEGGALTVEFSDGHRDVFPTDVLVRMASLPDDLPPMTAWDASLGAPPRHDWAAVMGDDLALADALEDFLVHGCVLVGGAPTTVDTVQRLGSRFGVVRTTNFGTIFDVQSKPNPNDLAYTAIPLGPHTDNPYRDPVPGIQLLHCLVNETSGGASTLVDALAVTACLRDEDPVGFELLATVEVQFQFRDSTDDIRRLAPVVSRTARGEVTGLAYSPRLDYVPMLSPAEYQSYQRARQRLAELLADPRFEIRFTLAAGEIEVFDNARVLHGRTGFDPQEGARHLQGCYIDVDAPRSRYRVLRKVGR